MFEQIYTNEERMKMIRKEKSSMKRLFRDLSESKKKIAEKLFEEAAVYKVQIKEAREIYIRDGLIETYQNGKNQSGQKKSSAFEVQDKAINTYMKLVKQLIDLLPEEEADVAGDRLLAFIKD